MADLDADRFPPILTTAMAAELLHVHVEYLRRMVREGRIPAHRFPGGREIRFHRDELIELGALQPGYNRSPSADSRDERDVPGRPDRRTCTARGRHHRRQLGIGKEAAVALAAHGRARCDHRPQPAEG